MTDSSRSGCVVAFARFVLVVLAWASVALAAVLLWAIFGGGR